MNHLVDMHDTVFCDIEKLTMCNHNNSNDGKTWTNTTDVYRIFKETQQTRLKRLRQNETDKSVVSQTSKT